MTEHARQFVTPLTFKEISGNAVATSMWNSNQEFNVEHIALADMAPLSAIYRRILELLENCPER